MTTRNALCKYLILLQQNLKTGNALSLNTWQCNFRRSVHLRVPLLFRKPSDSVSPRTWNLALRVSPNSQSQIQSVRLCSSKETDISNRVLECIRQFDKLGAKSAEVELNSRFAQDLSMDSLDHVEMIMSIEDEFGVEIPDAELESMDTPAKIVEYLINKADLPNL
ncbi:mtacp1 [Bugula neritina]|uniref:Acyl carrier protein n=1 Tax=Bugula neritina TaxID=10212 RepID=A0A7J7JZZ1_BUGNE|nr:mtacp1 [Bugula neritina]